MTDAIATCVMVGVAAGAMLWAATERGRAAHWQRTAFRIADLWRPQPRNVRGQFTRAVK